MCLGLTYVRSGRSGCGNLAFVSSADASHPAVFRPTDKIDIFCRSAEAEFETYRRILAALSVSLDTDHRKLELLLREK